jgi:hypothetical protein
VLKTTQSRIAAAAAAVWLVGWFLAFGTSCDYGAFEAFWGVVFYTVVFEVVAAVAALVVKPWRRALLLMLVFIPIASLLTLVLATGLGGSDCVSN